MSDVMRDEFEEWQSKETPGADLEHCGELIGNGPARVSYRNMYVAERWIGWQASRERLVIELPKTAGLDRMASDMSMQEIREDNRFNRALDLAKKALTAAGVKTK